MSGGRARRVCTGAFVALLLALAGCRNEPAPPASLLPGLAEALPGLDRVLVEQGDERFELRREGEQWRIEGAAWRADRRWLQPLLLGLAEARCDEPRTADPARFARIGVAWPAVPVVEEGQAFARPVGRVSLPVTGQERQVVVGYPHARGGTFVRVEGATHSCLTRAELRLPSRASEWFDPMLWASAPAAPESVSVEDRDAPPLRLLRRGERYVPEGQAMALTPLADGLVAALMAPRQQALRALSPESPAPQRVLRFETGAAAHALGLRREGPQTWAQVLEAPDFQREGFEGREFLLPPDVAEPLWASRESLGGSP